MSTAQYTTAAQRTVQILIKHGYQCIRGEKIEGSRLEWWAGQKGTIIVQFWDDKSDGATTYCGWSMGVTFEDLEKALALEIPRFTD